jgi:two-component system cell cycle response regulator CtrA
MKVLAIGLNETTLMFLRAHGIAAEPQDVADAEDFESWIRDGIYDAAVLDLEESGLGIYVARPSREHRIVTPVIGVSRGTEGRPWSDHRALFLENGGDDLIKGPVNPRELAASLRAASRRFTGSLHDVTEFRSGTTTLRINRTTSSVAVNGTPLDLTGKERDILLLLASSPGRVLTKEMLLNQLYTDGVEDEPCLKIIDVFICKLRKKLAAADVGTKAFIDTVWGRGYRFPLQSELDAPLRGAA